MTISGEYWWVNWRPEGIDWAQIDADGRTPRQDGHCRDWDNLPIPPGSQVVLCVPGAYIRIHTVTIPTRNRRQLLDALPFALEDRLLHTHNEYHYVLMPKARGQTETNVAVVERKHMDYWQDTIERHEWRLLSLIPEYLALPVPDPETWLLEATTPPILMRREDGSGAALPGEINIQPPGALLIAIEASQRRPGNIHVMVRDGEQKEIITQWHSVLAASGITLDISEIHEPRNSYLAGQPLPDDKFNILGSTYNPTTQARPWIKRLLPTAVLVAGLLLVLTLRWFLEDARIHREYRELHQEITATYLQAFPKAKNLVDPRYQMEKRIERLANGRLSKGGKASFLTCLEILAPVLVGTKGSQLQALSYDGSNMLLDISMPDFDSLTRLQKRLEQNATVDVQDARLKDGRVYSHIRMEVPG